MRIERVTPLRVAGLHRNLPASFDALFQERRERVLKLRFRQMIEQDFGHRARRLQTYDS